MNWKGKYADKRRSNAKVSQRDVDTIRLVSTYGVSVKALALSWKLSPSHVYRILNGTRWGVNNG